MSKSKTMIIFFTMGFSTTVLFNNCAEQGNSSSANSGPPLVTQEDIIECDLSVQLSRLAKLSDTCFGKLEAANATSSSFFDNFSSFKPNYPLASVTTPLKSRWIYLPPETQIDNSDPDNWVYPVGTILWKEFANENVRIETRMMEKVSDGVGITHWRPYIFYWTMDQSEAHYFPDDEFPEGPELAGQYAYDNYITRDGGGTIVSYDDYKVPKQSECLSCHSGSQDVVLGFSGLQLYGQNTGWRLTHLVDGGLLSSGIVNSYAIAGSENNRKVIGLMQSNCASCHSPFNVDPFPRTNAVFKLNSDAKEPSEMVPIQSLLANNKMVPGDADNSRIVCRLEGNCDGGSSFMPPTIDGIPQQHFGFSALVREWINEM